MKEVDHAFKITIASLNGINYAIWAKSISLFLCSKGKLEYINGKISKPKVTDASFSEWEANDCTIMSWFLNDMSPEIAKGFIFQDYAKEIWDYIAEIYGEKKILLEYINFNKILQECAREKSPFIHV